MALNETVGKTGLLDLPNEILDELATFLSLQPISRLARVNRRCRTIFEEILYRRDAQDKYPEALHGAAFSGNLGTATKALAQLKGDTPTPIPMKTGWSPLSLAMHMGHRAVVKLLLDSGGRIVIDINERDPLGSTPLIHACQSPDRSIAELVLSVDGIDIHQTNNIGTGPLAAAACAGNLEAVKLLVSLDDAQPDPKGRFSEPLWYSAGEGHEDVVRFLLETCKSDAAAYNAEGRMPLHRVASTDKTSVVKLLLAADGVDVNAKDNEGCSALHYAALGGHVSTIEVLLDVEGVDPNSKDRFGKTPLMYAARREGNSGAIRFLLERGVDPETEDDRGMTDAMAARAPDDNHAGGQAL